EQYMMTSVWLGMDSQRSLQGAVERTQRARPGNTRALKRTLPDPFEDPVQLVEVVILDDELAALAGVVDGDAGAEALGQLLLDAADVAAFRRLPALRGTALGRLKHAPDELLGLAHRQAPVHDHVAGWPLSLAGQG